VIRAIIDGFFGSLAVTGFVFRFLQEFNVEKDFDVKNKYQKAGGQNFSDTLGALLRKGFLGSKRAHLFFF